MQPGGALARLAEQQGVDQEGLRKDYQVSLQHCSFNAQLVDDYRGATSSTAQGGGGSFKKNL